MPQKNDDSNVQPTDEIPAEDAGNQTRSIGATAMKAFAHPLRMAMYDYLNDRGSATATMLAKHTGESTGQTSYHLRQLERHGFVTDDPTRGTGRERWWKALGFSMHGVELAKDQSTRPAIKAMLSNQVEQRSEALYDWFERSEQEEPDWVNVSTTSRHSMMLTQEEFGQLTKRLSAVLNEYSIESEKRKAAGPEGEQGTRRVRVYLDAFPLADDE